MVRTIDVEEVARLRQDDVPVIDVLPEESYRRGHLPGAVNVPLDPSFEARIQEEVPDRDKPVVVYCTDPRCETSPMAAHVMEEHLGYSDVRHFEGGLVGWRRAGRELEGTGPQRLRLQDLDADR